jgi:ferritin-like metal-binding protein YciE
LSLREVSSRLLCDGTHKLSHFTAPSGLENGLGNAVHANSYEHTELAAYDLLARVAERARDTETAETAREIAAEEREMAHRLEAASTSPSPHRCEIRLPTTWTSSCTATWATLMRSKKPVTSLLQLAPKVVGEGRVATLFDLHLEETREHARLVKARLEERGSSPSRMSACGSAGSPRIRSLRFSPTRRRS